MNATVLKNVTALNDILFDKNLGLCVSLIFLMRVTDALQAVSSMSHFCSPSAFFSAFAVPL